MQNLSLVLQLERILCPDDDSDEVTNDEYEDDLVKLPCFNSLSEAITHLGDICNFLKSTGWGCFFCEDVCSTRSYLPCSERSQISACIVHWQSIQVHVGSSCEGINIYIHCTIGSFHFLNTPTCLSTLCMSLQDNLLFHALCMMQQLEVVNPGCPCRCASWYNWRNTFEHIQVMLIPQPI